MYFNLNESWLCLILQMWRINFLSSCCLQMSELGVILCRQILSIGIWNVNKHMVKKMFEFCNFSLLLLPDSSRLFSNTFHYIKALKYKKSHFVLFLACYSYLSAVSFYSPLRGVNVLTFIEMSWWHDIRQ